MNICHMSFKWGEKEMWYLRRYYYHIDGLFLATEIDLFFSFFLLILWLQKAMLPCKDHIYFIYHVSFQMKREMWYLRWCNYHIFFCAFHISKGNVLSAVKYFKRQPDWKTILFMYISYKFFNVHERKFYISTTILLHSFSK